jgi:hypothetical protein
MKIFAFVFVLLITTIFAQDFSGTYRDDAGDRHSFEMQPDGTLLGRLTIDDAVVEVPFELDNGQAIGVANLGGNFIGFIITSINANQLSVQVVPIGADNQPIMEQVVSYTFTRDTTTAQVPSNQNANSQPSTQIPLGSKPGAPQNPLTTQATNPLATPASPTPTSLNGIAIEANQLYNAGTTLVSSAAGFSLTVPVGNMATYTMTETGQAALVVGDQQRGGFIVLGLSKADSFVLAQSSLTSFGELQLTPVGTPQQTTDMFRATFQADAHGTPLAIHLAAKQGAAGNAVVMMGFALVGQDAGLSQALDSALNSLTFSQPAPQTALSLGGLELNANDGSSISNSSGDAHLSGIKEEFYIFCSDGSYAYSMADTTLFSTGGLSGDFGDFSSEETDQHNGRYALVSGILAEPYLFLAASDGRSFLYPVSQSAQRLMIGTSSFGVVQSSQCQ